MFEFITQPWPWYVSGVLIAGIMLLMLLFDKSFGVSSTFRHVCSACGAGKMADFFNYEWKSQSYSLLFVLGAAIGGWISAQYLMPDLYAVDISMATRGDLLKLGFINQTGLAPAELFGSQSVDLKQIALLSIGGFLIGFGTRYAGGCTSGHAISGLSNLQLPSLVAVVGFFVGGLLMTHVLFPIIF